MKIIWFVTSTKDMKKMAKNAFQLFCGIHYMSLNIEIHFRGELNMLWSYMIEFAQYRFSFHFSSFPHKMFRSFCNFISLTWLLKEYLDAVKCICYLFGTDLCLYKLLGNCSTYVSLRHSTLEKHFEHWANIRILFNTWRHTNLY